MNLGLDNEMMALRAFKVQRNKQMQLEHWIEKHFPGSRAIYEKTADIHHSMPVWQCMLLGAIGRWFNYPEANILEIGSAKGGSAAIWAEAAPLATIRCMEPARRFQSHLAKIQKRYSNIEIWQTYSWDLLKHVQTEVDFPRWYDLIFVDGNHVLVHRDLPWWNYLKIGGLMLFDDYTPHIYPAVCAAVRDLWEAFGRDGPGILARRIDKAGMVGIWKMGQDEVWPATNKIE